MSLLERLEQEYIRASKARDADAVSTLRLLRAALKNTQIEKMHPLSDDEAIDVVTKEVKKLKDSRESFVAGGRADLINKTDHELALLQTYLPAGLSDDELAAIVAQVIAQSIVASATEGAGATAMNFGKIMGEVMKLAKGRADGGRVSAAVKSALEKKV